MENSLCLSWRAAGGRVAVAAGAGMALVSLIQHLPLEVSARRGGLVWLGVIAVTRITAVALTKLAPARGEARRV